MGYTSPIGEVVFYWRVISSVIVRNGDRGFFMLREVIAWTQTVVVTSDTQMMV